MGLAPHLPLLLSLQLSLIAEFNWQDAFLEEKGLLLPCQPWMCHGHPVTSAEDGQQCGGGRECSDEGADPAESSLWKELLFFKQAGLIQLAVTHPEITLVAREGWG